MRRLEHVGLADAAALADQLERSMTFPPRTRNTWTTAPRGPVFTPHVSRSPILGVDIFCCRSRSVTSVRIASRNCAARSNRSSPAACCMRSVSSAISSSLRPSSSSRASSTARAYSLGRTERGDAWRQAAFDVVLETRTSALAGDDLVAGADAEQPVSQAHRPPAERGRQERPGVDLAVFFDAANHLHPRERFGRRQPKIGVVLVVPEQDVVLRRPLLDQVVLERERLHHRVGDDELDPVGLVEERVGFWIGTVHAEIAADAIPQRARLPDVDRVAGGT